MQKNWGKFDFFYMAGGILLISIVAAVIFWPILFPSVSNTIPWGSDTLGHASRVNFLNQAISEIHSLPTIIPNWYLGIQLFRYYPPLPYFIILGIKLFANSTVAAINWFLLLASLFGAYSWLLYQRWIGKLGAILGGILFLMIPDNIRVAFAEGNIPRVLASCLIPLLFYLVLDLFDRKDRIGNLIGIGLIFAISVFCHPMMAAIYAVFTGGFLLLVWILGSINFVQFAKVMAAIFLGIASSAVWLFPSLTGGITDINSTAVTQGLISVPLTTLLNPLARISNPEGLYFGISIFILSFVPILYKKVRNKIPLSFSIVGILGTLISTPILFNLFMGLPGHNLLWPQRFLGIASFMLLFSTLWVLKELANKKLIWISIILAVPILLDFGVSTKLIGLRPVNNQLATITSQLNQSMGWREATLDLSALGSQVDYLIDSSSEKEQVFGWAYQGASNATSIASINEAISMGAFPYLTDRLSLYGVDDVILLNSSLPYDQISSALEKQGFILQTQESTLTYLHRDGLPRAVKAEWQGLAIGSGAVNYSYLFPQIIQGDSNFVDEYTLNDLTRYKTVILSGFSWHNQAAAERLVRQAALAGINVVVDLTRAQEDPVAHIPNFLGVWGETIILQPSPLPALWNGSQVSLGMFGEAGSLWHTLTPQGLDKETISVDYLGKTATAIGEIETGGKRIQFIGLNLVYHALLTHDPITLEILSSVLQFEYAKINTYQSIPLDFYQAGPKGYSFVVNLMEKTSLVVPVTVFDGTWVTIDGELVSHRSLDKLVVFESPAGSHQIQIRFQETPIYQIGKGVSMTSAGIALGWLIYYWVSRRRKVAGNEKD
jgi:uncharacterized membrane protein